MMILDVQELFDNSVSLDHHEKLGGIIIVNNPEFENDKQHWKTFILGTSHSFMSSSLFNNSWEHP